MQNMFDKCPACGGPLVITECQCSRCQLQMRGEFQPGRFFCLSAEQMTFIQVFLSTRGNLSEVERILGISYPTIRNKLDEINEILKRTGEAAKESRKQILQDVADGKLSPVAAVEKLGQTLAERD